MGSKVTWSRSALDDVRLTIEYIAKDSRIYADRFRAEVRIRAQTLDRFASRGRHVPELERDDVREVLLGSYRMINLLQNDQVYIVAFIHGSRNLETGSLSDRL